MTSRSSQGVVEPSHDTSAQTTSMVHLTRSLRRFLVTSVASRLTVLKMRAAEAAEDRPDSRATLAVQGDQMPPACPQ